MNLVCDACRWLAQLPVCHYINIRTEALQYNTNFCRSAVLTCID